MAPFIPPFDGKEQEEGTSFRPKFDANGLITAVAVDETSGEILMLAHMNAEALEKTLQTGKAHYYSRSRKKIWLKGETSGNIQMVAHILTDCDQDAIVMKVRVEGSTASCHTGRVSCFYRTVTAHDDGSYNLKMDDKSPLFDPKEVYKDE